MSLAPRFRDGEYVILQGTDEDFLYYIEKARLFRLSKEQSTSFSSAASEARKSRQLCKLLSENRSQNLSERKYLGVDLNSPAKLVLLMSHGCNLGCTYCFQSKINLEKRFMSVDTAKDAIRSYPARYIAFFGGEPLLRFKEISEIVEFTEKMYFEGGKDRPIFEITTNATVMTKQIADFFKIHNFHVSVSLDGPSTINDALRVFPSIKSTYDLVLRGIDILKFSGVNFTLVATYTNFHVMKNISPTETMKHLLRLGAKQVYISIVFGQTMDGFEGDYLFVEGQSEYLYREFKLMAENVVESLASDRTFVVGKVKRFIRQILEGSVNATTCDAGLDNVTVDESGQVYPCYMLKQESMSMGNVHDGKALLGSQRFVEVQSKMAGNERKKITMCSECCLFSSNYFASW